MLMEESVRLATEKVPAWVGRSLPGGARAVYWGSQRMSLAVVSWAAMRNCDEGAGGVEELGCSGEGLRLAVVGDGARDLGDVPGKCTFSDKGWCCEDSRCSALTRRTVAKRLALRR